MTFILSYKILWGFNVMNKKELEKFIIKYFTNPFDPINCQMEWNSINFFRPWIKFFFIEINFN